MGISYQKIPNSSKVLYYFEAVSKLNDSMIDGYVLFDSTEIVTMDKINSRLPFKYLTHLPDDNLIKGVRFLSPKDQFDIDYDIKNKININEFGIHIEAIEKEYFGGYSTVNCLLHEYEFGGVQEIKDSIYFYELTTERKSLPIFESGIGFKKGNVFLEVNPGSDQINQITVYEIVEEKGDLYKYKKGSNELGELIEDKLVVCVRTYFLKPKRIMYQSEFSDYGIFKGMN